MFSVQSSPFNNFATSCYGGWAKGKYLRPTARSLIPFILDFHLNHTKEGYNGPSWDELRAVYEKLSPEDQVLVRMIVPRSSVAKKLRELKNRGYYNEFFLDMAYPRNFLRKLKNTASSKSAAEKKAFLRHHGLWLYPQLTELRKSELDKLYKALMAKQRKQQRDVRRERRKR